MSFLTNLNHHLFMKCRSRHHTIVTTKSQNTIMVSPHVNDVTPSPDSNDDSGSGKMLWSSLVLQVAEKQKRLSVSSIKSTKSCLATNTGDKASKANASMRVFFKQPTRWQSEDLSGDICPTMPLRKRSRNANGKQQQHQSKPSEDTHPHALQLILLNSSIAVLMDDLCTMMTRSVKFCCTTATKILKSGDACLKKNLRYSYSIG
jgi:hypothetical protein